MSDNAVNITTHTHTPKKTLAQYAKLTKHKTTTELSSYLIFGGAAVWGSRYFQPVASPVEGDETFQTSLAGVAAVELLVGQECATESLDLSNSLQSHAVFRCAGNGDFFFFKGVGWGGEMT